MVVLKAMDIYVFGKNKIDATQAYVHSMVVFAKQLVVNSVTESQLLVTSVVSTAKAKAKATTDYAQTMVKGVYDSAMVLIKK
jgi:Na+/alanine symporter